MAHLWFKCILSHNLVIDPLQSLDKGNFKL